MNTPVYHLMLALLAMCSIPPAVVADKSIVANETFLAFTPASELFAVSPENDSPPANNDPIGLSASNVTAPEPIQGKPPKLAWLAKHKFDGVDFTLPSPDLVEDPSHRSLRRGLQQKVTTWACYNRNRGRYVSSVKIWWGHKQEDGQWACNTWRTGLCKNSCVAYEVSDSHWNCYRQRDLKFVGQVSIWWGHDVVDGVWACNNWDSDCKNSPGGCLVTGAPHWYADQATWGCDAYKTADGCSGGFQHERDALRFACDQHDYCYFGPIKNDFWDTYRHCSNLFYDEVKTRHWGLFDPMRIAGETWYFTMTLDPVWNGNPVGGPGLGDAFQNRQLASDAECYLGKSKPQGYQRAPCQSGGGCLAGTSCYNCCDGDSGWACNKPWWE